MLGRSSSSKVLQMPQLGSFGAAVSRSPTPSAAADSAAATARRRSCAQSIRVIEEGAGCSCCRDLWAPQALADRQLQQDVLDHSHHSEQAVGR